MKTVQNIEHSYATIDEPAAVPYYCIGYGILASVTKWQHWGILIHEEDTHTICIHVFSRLL